MRPLIEASIINQEYEENINVTLKRSRHSWHNQFVHQYNQTDDNIYWILQTAKVAWWYLLNHTYLPWRLHDFKIPSNIQIIPFEINLRKGKWLFASIYNVPSQKNKYFLWYLRNLLKFYWTRYEKIIILSDFNVEPENKVMKDFL